jgi:NAD(P)-dependent dehydrogenase (short-subunit alcohol dehydrogenase family)
MSNNRIAVVTGASRGAAAGIARALGAHKYTSTSPVAPNGLPTPRFRALSGKLRNK